MRDLSKGKSLGQSEYLLEGPAKTVATPSLPAMTTACRAARELGPSFQPYPGCVAEIGQQHADARGQSDLRWHQESDEAYRGVMASRNMLFRAMYRVGFTPWDGHPLAKSLHDLVEGNGSPALPAATALDIGCGTGDASIYLAQHGWQVTGVDFVPRALAKARAKAQARQARINFVQADVTHLSSARGVGTGFTLIVDNGCLHNLTDKDRDAYVREVTAVAAPDALLLIGGLDPGEQFGVRGITRAEIERRFTPAWTLLSAGDAPEMARFGKGHYSLLQPRQ